MPKHTILLVDDEAAIRDMLSIALEAADFNVLQAENAQQAHASIIDRQPDLVLLDWMMPGTTGLELLRRLKRDELTEKIPVIMLTAKAEEDSKISGLDAGADDYIPKPFSPRELISRVKAVMRRIGREELKDVINVGEMHFDPQSHRVSISGEYINLGPTEYRLLQFFFDPPGARLFQRPDSRLCLGWQRLFRRADGGCSYQTIAQSNFSCRP